MELFDFKTAAEYEKSMLGFYKDDPLFINNKSGTFHIVCNPKGAFFKNTVQKMIGVRADGEILCQCVLIKHKAHDAVTVSFFEARQNAGEAVNLIMSAAACFAEALGSKRLEIALDGHCNYGVGFSCETYETSPLFGESYSHDYYHDYFKDDCTRICFTSYTDSYVNLTDKLDGFKDSSDISIETADFRNFSNTMKRYTDLCNAIFARQRYCFFREYAEDYELFSGLKPLLSPYNMLFARKGDQDIGLLFAYPDYNSFVSPGSKVGIGTFIRYKLFRRPVHTMKVVQIGVLPDFRNSSTILMLFKEAIRQTGKNHPFTDRVFTSWVMDDNIESRRIASRLLPGVYKKYIVYDKEI